MSSPEIRSPLPLVPEAVPPDLSMIWIPGGAYVMGSNRHYADEAPAHEVRVDGFWMDPTTVTNAAFRRFVEETGYVTFAERPPNPADYPGALPELLVPGSAVFHPPDGPVDLRDTGQWWAYVPGACWRNPEGPHSAIEGREDHPVVHIAFEDAEAYARWAGKALPTEAEWERAARGGLECVEFVWGDELSPGGKMMANYWQGRFPWENLVTDGFAGTAPVRSFEPNGFGLFQMAGNVWEWTEDWYRARHLGAPPGKSCCIPSNPRGTSREASLDPNAPLPIPRKVLKGGSFLCAPSYCLRYRPAARYPQTIDTTTSHIGFRCIARSARSA